MKIKEDKNVKFKKKIDINVLTNTRININIE